MKTIRKLNKICATSLAIVLLVSVFSTNAFGETERNPNVKSIKVEYKTKIGESTYYIQFKTCLGNKHAMTPTFIIDSDMGSKTQKYQKIHQANSCKSYETKVKAEYANSVSIRMIESSGFV